jgi:hypothetical protein
MNARCQEVELQIEDLFVEGRSPAEGGATLLVHLDDCPGCRALYERCFTAEALLTGPVPGDGGASVDAAGPPARLGPHEQDLVWGLIRERLGAAASPGPGEGIARVPAAGSGGAVSSWKERWARWRQRLVWSSLGMATAAVVALLVVRTSDDGDGFSARRSSGSAAALGRVGLQMACLSEGNTGPVVRSLPDAPLPGERPLCTQRDRLGFFYRNETGWPQRMTVAVREGQKWRRLPARLLPPTGEKEPLAPVGGLYLELSSLGPGPRELAARFEPAPGGPAGRTDRDGPTVVRLRLEVAP